MLLEEKIIIALDEYRPNYSVGFLLPVQYKLISSRSSVFSGLNLKIIFFETVFCIGFVYVPRVHPVMSIH